MKFLHLGDHGNIKLLEVKNYPCYLYKFVSDGGEHTYN